jgi:hypothetical protein
MFFDLGLVPIIISMIAVEILDQFAKFIIDDTLLIIDAGNNFLKSVIQHRCLIGDTFADSSARLFDFVDILGKTADRRKLLHTPLPARDRSRHNPAPIAATSNKQHTTVCCP